MEAAYGIGVQNRYALFLDEDVDPSLLDVDGPVTSKTAPAPSTKTSQAGRVGPGTLLAAKPASAGAGKPLTESKTNQATNQRDQTRTGRVGPGNRNSYGNNQRSAQNSRENQENRGGNYNRSPRPVGTDGVVDTQAGGDFGSKDFRGGDRRNNGYANRGGPRGDRRPAGAVGDKKFGSGPGGKRDFNRHSGSDRGGVKSIDKREGGGAHNWGKATDEQNHAPDEVVNGDAGERPEAVEKTGEEGTGNPEDTNVVGEEEKNEEDNLKTLDEYKRELEEKRMHSQFNIRKANEGEDKTKWKKTYVLKKKPDNEEEEVEYEEIEVEEDSSKRRHRKLEIEVAFRPSDEGRDLTRRPRGGQGGRGGGGDRRGNDAPRERRERPEGEQGDRPRGPRPSGGPGAGRGGGFAGRGGRGGGRFQPAPKFDDLNDFPSL